MSEMTEHEQQRLAIRRGEDPDVVPVSPSSMKLYDTCPRWYAYEYGGQVGGVRLVEKLPRVRGAAAELGDRFHRLVQEVTAGADPDEAAERMGVPLELWHRWKGLRKRAAELAGGDRGDGLAGVEEAVRMRFPLPDGREAELEMRLDELWLRDDGTAVVVDYKTGNAWGLPAGAELKRDPVLLAYALGVQHAHPSTWQWEVVLVLPESGEVRRATVEFKHLEEFREVLVANITGMAEDVEFRPKPGKCHLCPYAVSHCPLGQALNGPHRPIVDEQGAQDAAQLLLYVEGVQQQLKDRLEDWILAEGPVPVGNGRFYGRRTYASWTIAPDDMPDAIRVLRQAGIEDGDGFPIRWDGKAGWKLLRGDPHEVIPELAEMAVKAWRTWTGFFNDPSQRRGGVDGDAAGAR